jgi:hypothetical protein
MKKDGKPKGIRVGQILRLGRNIYVVMLKNGKERSFRNREMALKFTEWYKLNVNIGEKI